MQEERLTTTSIKITMTFNCNCNVCSRVVKGRDSTESYAFVEVCKNCINTCWQCGGDVGWLNPKMITIDSNNECMMSENNSVRSYYLLLPAACSMQVRRGVVPGTWYKKTRKKIFLLHSQLTTFFVFLFFFHHIVTFIREKDLLHPSQHT